LDNKIIELRGQRDALDNRINESRNKREEVEQKMRPLRRAIRERKKERPHYWWSEYDGGRSMKGELMEMGDMVTYYGRQDDGEEAKILIIRGMKDIDIITGAGETVKVTIPLLLKLKSRDGVVSKDGANLPRKRKRDSEQAGNVGSSSTMYFKY